MRICLATPLYPPDPGGPATYARSLEEGLPATGIDVSIVSFGSVRWLPPGLRHFVYFLLLVKKGREADLLLALDPVSVGLPAALAAKLLRKPLVMKVVGDYAWEQGRQRFGVTESLDQFSTARSLAFEVRMLKRIEAWTARQARSIIVPSEYLKRIVSSWEGIDVSRITVIYNAMRNEEGGIVPAAVLALPHPRIVTIGRLVPWKQVDSVIDAVSQITDASLVIVGDGPSRTRLEERAGEKLGERAVFTGALPHDATLAVLHDADIFVLNSTYEGLSHLLIEALALGVPSIATNVGGNPELITHDVNGLLIPSRDTAALTAAISRLISDGALRTQLSDAGKASSERFTMEAMIHKTASLLTSLV